MNMKAIEKKKAVSLHPRFKYGQCGRGPNIKWKSILQPVGYNYKSDHPWFSSRNEE